MFNVVYGKVTSKKHKTWEGDGLLEVIGKSAVLKVTLTNQIFKILYFIFSLFVTHNRT